MLEHGVFWACAPALHNRIPWERYAPDLDNRARCYALLFILDSTGAPTSLAPGLARVMKLPPDDSEEALLAYSVLRGIERRGGASTARLQELGLDLARSVVETPGESASTTAVPYLRWLVARSLASCPPDALAYLRTKAASGKPEERMRARELLAAIEGSRVP